MRRVWTSVVAGALGVALASCSQPRPAANAACAYRAIPLRVDADHPPQGMFADLLPTTDDAVSNATLAATPPETGAQIEAGSFAAEVARVVEEKEAGAPPPPQGRRGEPAPAPVPVQFLVLSGGSQHGAFGAGFFHGLKAVPRYDIVTGVSTGSLQSTLLFLANTKPPGDRDYRWVDGPLAAQVKPGTSNTGDLVLAYSIDKEGDIATPESGGLLGGLAQGALATFGPLKARLKALLSPETLRQVAAEAAAGRKLYVGVSNLDDGQGYAIDLTELAARVDLPAWKDRTSELQDCYVEALVASSSVPPAAFPVSLAIQDGDQVRTDMYMDGGARYGVFLQQLAQALGTDMAPGAQVTVIVNGNLYGSPWTRDGKPVDNWTSLTLANRAVQLLENQVYRFSVASAENFGLRHGGMLMAFISNEGLPPGSGAPLEHRFEGKTCAEWKAIDAKNKPLEFYPWYMACVSDYGRERGAADAWNRRFVRPMIEVAPAGA